MKEPSLLSENREDYRKGRRHRATGHRRTLSSSCDELFEWGHLNKHEPTTRLTTTVEVRHNFLGLEFGGLTSEATRRALER